MLPRPLMLAVMYNQPFAVLALIQAGMRRQYHPAFPHCSSDRDAGPGARTEIKAPDGKTALQLSHRDSEHGRYIVDLLSKG